MARPVQEKSIDGQAGTGPGSRLETGGRITVSLFVVAANLDPSNDTLEVELNASMDGDNWDGISKLQTAEGTGANLEASDFTDKDGDGTYTAFVSVHGIAARYIRARVASFTDNANGDLSIDAWIAATSNTSTPKDYRETRG